MRQVIIVPTLGKGKKQNRVMHSYTCPWKQKDQTGIQGQTWLHSELKATLSYREHCMRSHFKTKTKQMRVLSPSQARGCCDQSLSPLGSHSLLLCNTQARDARRETTASVDGPFMAISQCKMFPSPSLINHTPFATGPLR